MPDVCEPEPTTCEEPAAPQESEWNPTSSADCERQADSLRGPNPQPGSGWNRNQLIKMCEDSQRDEPEQEQERPPEQSVYQAEEKAIRARSAAELAVRGNIFGSMF
jgi:hypothetical protein